MKLWLDDIRKPPSPQWLWIKNSQDAINLISQNEVEEISFDHDLGEEDTGYKVAVFIEEKAFFNQINKIKWNIHSANPVGRNKIQAAMSAADCYWNK